MPTALFQYPTHSIIEGVNSYAVLMMVVFVD